MLRRATLALRCSEDMDAVISRDRKQNLARSQGAGHLRGIKPGQTQPFNDESAISRVRGGNLIFVI